jgi:hypothetical protein
MSTLVLTRGSDPHAVQAHRCGPGIRLLVRARSLSLDRALGRGISPDSGVALSLRAHALISRAHRLSLARHLRRTARAAGRPRPRFDPLVPVPAHVTEVQDLIDEVTETLEGAEAVDARGVALLQVLLHDGGGPLFDARAGCALRRALEHALAALAPDQGHETRTS